MEYEEEEEEDGVQSVGSVGNYFSSLEFISRLSGAHRPPIT